MTPGKKPISDDDKTTIQGILTYWFPSAGYDRHTSYPMECVKIHFMGGAEVDTYCRQNYETLLESIAAGQKEHWKQDRDGALAYIICCDQFSRNMHRDTAKAWAYDKYGLPAAKEIVTNKTKFDQYKNMEKLFILLAYEHSEEKENVRICKEIFEKLAEKA